MPGPVSLELTAAGCTRLFAEKITGAQLDHARQLIDRDDRPVKDVAALLGVHRSTLYRALDADTGG